MKLTERIAKQLITFAGSRMFFVITLVVFVLQAAWIALVARYPQAFDEQFHFGLIQLYAHHISPFWNGQPNHASEYGAVARDPSYLYQYLMSFPYRLIAFFTHDLTIQVIWLRFINIALLASGLVMFRKALRFTGASIALIQIVLLCFVLIPIVPLLGSQINYDNLLIPLSGLAIWWELRFIERLRKEGVWRWEALAQLAILCLFASIVKIAFLPIFAALVLVNLYTWLRTRHALRYRTPRVMKSAVYIALLVLAFGLCFQRYGINMLRYHTLAPQCNQVLTVEECKAYAPWARDYKLRQHNVKPTMPQLLGYPSIWIHQSMGELVFTIGSAFNDSGAVDYYVGTQLIVINVLGWVVFVAGVAVFAWYAKRFWQIEAIRIILMVIALYLVSLYLQNVKGFMRTGEAVAIHGRYLLPILPCMLVLIGLAFRQGLSSLRVGGSLQVRKAGVSAILVILMLFEGGGFTTYIIRSQPRWLWPQSPVAHQVERGAKSVLHPIVVGD